MKKAKISLWKQDGISIIELMITMTLVVIVLCLNTDTFGVIFKYSRQTNQAVGAQMDRAVGLEMLRTDLEHAGYGLPWSFRNAINYQEAASAGYNDAPSGEPRALVSGNGAGFKGSDYLVIKSPMVGMSDTSQRWSYIVGGQNPRAWGSNDLANDARVIVVSPQGTGEAYGKHLIMDDTAFFTAFNATSFPEAFSPSAGERYVIYGVDRDTDLRMPFNRADYYVASPSKGARTDDSDGCAPNTGILYKATLNHKDGNLSLGMPLVDCVADMQVVYGLDTDSDWAINSRTNDISAMTAADIRAQVREVRVYILSHEGPRDPSFRYPNEKVIIGESKSLGREFTLSTIGTDWQNYRWKVTTLVVRTRSLSS
ncbi:MAG: type II secretion system protein [Syntrophorhabdus aromaticivorans]|uniref:Type II secretion system protein n=1 Tax=Syntrophorhabdus aromaticivorans TaxID=328301 RepID=A0A971M5L7_9BACT|nr:type II secretion system protein [Syntrophorhabdus aromaticivorans]